MSTYYSTCFVNHSTEDDRSSVETCLVNLKKLVVFLKIFTCLLDLDIPRVGSDTRRVYTDHGTEVTLAIWDFPDIERSCDAISPLCRKAHAVIVVYDITRLDSLRNASRWFDILRGVSSPNIFMALTGNKADLVGQREVKYEVIRVSIRLRKA